MYEVSSQGYWRSCLLVFYSWWSGVSWKCVHKISAIINVTETIKTGDRWGNERSFWLNNDRKVTKNNCITTVIGGNSQNLRKGINNCSRRARLLFTWPSDGEIKSWEDSNHKWRLQSFQVAMLTDKAEAKGEKVGERGNVEGNSAKNRLGKETWISQGGHEETVNNEAEIRVEDWAELKIQVFSQVIQKI